MGISKFASIRVFLIIDEKSSNNRMVANFYIPRLLNTIFEMQFLNDMKFAIQKII